jgi:CBS domain-containing protein
MLDEHGLCVATITEGDMLRKLVRGAHLSVRDIDRVRLTDVPGLRTARAVGIEAQVEELFNRALDQNFVPVVDSRNVFVGIVRRREILGHCTGTLPAREP